VSEVDDLMAAIMGLIIDEPHCHPRLDISTQSIRANIEKLVRDRESYKQQLGEVTYHYMEQENELDIEEKLADALAHDLEKCSINNVNIATWRERRKA
jgi:hypothetical protein